MAIGVRNSLGQEELAQLADEGGSLSIGEAVAYALREADPFGGGRSTISPVDT